MSESEHAPVVAVRLVLEIDAGTEPLSGRIGGNSASLEPFVGWTELGQAITRLTGCG